MRCFLRYRRLFCVPWNVLGQRNRWPLPRYLAIIGPMTIQDFRDKCKDILKNEQFLTAVIVVLVGVGSFCLGRLSVLEEQKTPLAIEYGPFDVVASVNQAVAA